MCRTYGHGPRRYVRLCYKTGRKGQKIIIGEKSIPGGCYRTDDAKAYRDEMSQPIKARRICPRCCSTAISRHDSICWVCQVEEDREKGRAKR